MGKVIDFQDDTPQPDSGGWSAAIAGDSAPIACDSLRLAGSLEPKGTDGPTRLMPTAPQQKATDAPPGVDDGYLLVLLADQELTAGRDQQAQHLLDAAYAAFDERARAGRA